MPQTPAVQLVTCIFQVDCGCLSLVWGLGTVSCGASLGKGPGGVVSAEKGHLPHCPAVDLERLIIGGRLERDPKLIDKKAAIPAFR